MQTYSNDDSFKVYVDYLALKRHFTSDDYDYFKYNGKTRASFDKFMTRQDAYYFNKLTKNNESRNLMLSNIVRNPNTWIRDICDEQGKEIYLTWKKNVDSLTHLFKSDLSKLDLDYKKNFEVRNGHFPILLNLYMQRQISLETFSILYHLSKVETYWNDEISDKIISKDVLRLAKKYYPFLEVDAKKFSAIVKETFFPV